MCGMAFEAAKVEELKLHERWPRAEIERKRETKERGESSSEEESAYAPRDVEKALHAMCFAPPPLRERGERGE